MTTIRDTIRHYTGKVYVRIDASADGTQFLTQAEAEGFRFSDGVLPSARPWAKLFSLTPVEPGICLWQGDITTLRCDAIVNAANAGMTGCYQPCHSCIDNCIHTYAGMQLRNACAEIIAAQGHGRDHGRAGA